MFRNLLAYLWFLTEGITGGLHGQSPLSPTLMAALAAPQPLCWGQQMSGLGMLPSVLEAVWQPVLQQLVQHTQHKLAWAVE